MDKLYKDVPESLRFNTKEVILVLVAVNAAFLTSLINGVGVISVFASFLFAYVVAVTALVRFKKAPKDRSLIDDEYSFVSEDTVKGFVLLLHRLVFGVQSRIKAVQSPGDLRGIARLLVIFYLIGLVGTFLSLLTIVWIGGNVLALISLLANNEKARETFNSLSLQVSGLVSQGVVLANSKIPKYSDLKRE